MCKVIKKEEWKLEFYVLMALLTGFMQRVAPEPWATGFEYLNWSFWAISVLIVLVWIVQKVLEIPE